FFQAEDGIRDRNVTGVQTCALPISASTAAAKTGLEIEFAGRQGTRRNEIPRAPLATTAVADLCAVAPCGGARHHLDRAVVLCGRGRGDGHGRLARARSQRGPDL